jgi:biopolymer transport protein ExbB
MFDLIRDGGPFVWVLLGCSVVALTFILERLWALRRQAVMPVEVRSALQRTRESRELAPLRAVCESRPSALGRLLVQAIEGLRWTKDENASGLEVLARQEVVRLERGLVALEIIVGIAPLLGLVGTIYGIIPLFGDFGKAVGADNSLMAKGIAVALNKTLLGLLVAIPTLVAWSYFNKRVEILAVELEAECDGFLRRFYLPAPGSPPVATPEAAHSRPVSA